MSNPGTKATVQRARRLSGGVSLPELNTVSLRSRIMPTPVPGQFILPLPAIEALQIRVRAGEEVARYQVLASAGDQALPVLLSPHAGRIERIDETPLLARDQSRGPAILLTPDPSERTHLLEAITDYRTRQPAEIATRLLETGVLTIGEIPTDALRKADCLRGARARLLIINGIDGDPYCSARTALLREYAREVLNGASLLQYAAGAEQCVIAIHKDQSVIQAALGKEMTGCSIKLMPIPNRYPWHAERQLVQAATGLEVPLQEFPVDQGVLVLDAGAAYAAHCAVESGEAAVARVVTLTGKALQTPKNFAAWIGTPVAHLLDLCGVLPERLETTLAQGVMAGFPVADLQAGVSANTDCLIAAEHHELPARPPQQDCIRCGRCVSTCPVQLQPQELYDLARCQDHDTASTIGLMDCTECGACAYVCPSHIPLVEYFHTARAAVLAERHQLQQADYWQLRFQTHQARQKLQADRTRERKADKSDSAERKPTAANSFSRDQARQEIADAVARVQARRRQNKNPSTGND